MAQTTYGVPMSCGYVAFSTDCVTYTDISGYAQTVTPSEQTRITGDAYTFSGGVAIHKAGKRQPVTVVVNIVYTEDDAGAFDIVRAAWRDDEVTGCPGEYCLRWSPRGDTAGMQQYTIQGYIEGFLDPPMDASAGGPIICTFTMGGPKIDGTIKAS